MDTHQYAADELLRDGSSIHIRAMRPDDKQRLLEFHSRLSDESIYFRYFSFKRTLSEQDLRYLTELDFDRRVALVATLRGEGLRADDASERIIGVGRYTVIEPAGQAEPAGSAEQAEQAGQAEQAEQAGQDETEAQRRPFRAEVAFIVEDAHQGRGIAPLLLEHLVAIATARGITEFQADVLGRNNRMLDVFAGSGLVVQRSLSDGIFHVSFPIEATPEYLDARQERSRMAAAQSMRPFFEPRHVALVGASRREGTIGANLLANLLAVPFPGPIYPVNPTADTIQGLRAHPSVSAIGEPVDLAIIAVPAPQVAAAVDDCARAGVRALVVISAGFAETTDPTGRAQQNALMHMVRASGMRMVGPNCMGLLSTDPDAPLNATFAPTWPPAGNIGVLSQSGALGIAILDQARRLDLGISSFVSVGNKADVSGNDLLAYWSEDGRTRVILLYLESFGNPRRFAQLAPRVARDKPIVAVKSGRSAAGTRAASSHSAALASLDVAVDALFEQAGVIRTSTLKDLFNVAALLSTQPLPPGPRVAVVTNAGGPGILLADACEAQGLTMPEPTEDTRAALRSFLPPAASLSNPVDMIASATPEQFSRAIAAVGQDPNVDCLVAMYIPVQATGAEHIAAAIAEGAGQVPAHKPVLCVLLSAEELRPLVGRGPRGPLPCYGFPEDAALVLAAARRYAVWRERPRGSFIELAPFNKSAIRAVVDRVSREQAGAKDRDAPVWLAPKDVATMLKAADIDVVETELALPHEAAAAAARMQFPLVAKAVAPGVVHKSDVGGVIMGLESADAVAHAVDVLRQRMSQIGATLQGVLLQQQVAGGLEMIVGVTSDPTFGPLLVCGMGGVTVELLKDVSFRLPPVSDRDAAEMVTSLRSAPLLDGYRGHPPADRPAFIDLLQRVSALVEAAPEILEMDLNPVKVFQPGQGVVVVDARIRLQPAPIPS